MRKRLGLSFRPHGQQCHDTHTLALLHFLTGQPVVALSLFMGLCMWVNFNPLLQLCRRQSRLCQWLNISFRQKAFHGNFESVSKTKPTLPKFFDLPPSAVWPDRHWVYIEKTSNRPRRGKFTGRSRLASWSTQFCQWLKTKLKAIALRWKSSLLTTICPIDRKELQSCRLFTLAL